MNVKINPEPGEAHSNRAPRLSLFLATGCGLGYLPKAPGTWGSLLGILLFWLPFTITHARTNDMYVHTTSFVFSLERALQPFLVMVLAAAGVFTATRAARYLRKKDPQCVVIDEVSGQHLTLLMGLLSARAVDWQYLLAGFILFRVFDIWKPFPVRQLERLPGGWGIMADDWMAAIYAAAGLWLLAVIRR
jgi:phosphatidylglycerophosphatase A